jgi:hypothetical protein
MGEEEEIRAGLAGLAAAAFSGRLRHGVSRGFLAAACRSGCMISVADSTATPGNANKPVEK